MPNPSPDTALRRMVADLAQLHGDDIAAILGELDARQRGAVETLLRAHADYFDTAARPEPAAAFDAGQLSPWLVRRLRAAGGAALTDEARAALLDCAVRLYPAGAGP